jgi:N-acyl-phosphatidylethanolamine-hydrolysing phospholipase D
VLRWAWQRRRATLAPDPTPHQLQRALSAIARPHACAGELRLTWVGHATFLVQIEQWNVLTDPHFGDRASPLSWAGPRRFSPPGVLLDALPRIDAVLLSHDHYDHLDDGSVRRIARRWPDATWFVPLGYRQWLARRGAHTVVSMDWFETATTISGDDSLRVQALPAQHWTSRTPFDRRRRLWASWAIRSGGGRSVFFLGDSGYFPGLAEVRPHITPADALLIPIGAYEPRWFMKSAHMNPEEAVSAYLELGGRGVCAGMHWGTWRLTDEDPLEPPIRMRRAWHQAGLPAGSLWIPAHGETRRIAASTPFA